MLAVEASFCSSAQRVALDAVHDGLGHEQVRLLAACGSGGRHGRNTEREVHRKFSFELGGHVEPYFVTVTVNALDKPGVTQMDLPVFAPHEMFGEIYRQGADVFSAAFCGPHGPSEVVGACLCIHANQTPRVAFQSWPFTVWFCWPYMIKPLLVCWLLAACWLHDHRFGGIGNTK